MTFRAKDLIRSKIEINNKTTETPIPSITPNIQSSACHLLHAAFLPGLFFYPKDGSNMFLRNDFKRITWRYIPEDRTLLTTAVRPSNPAIKYLPNIIKTS
jgi:hypothetical protein